MEYWQIMKLFLRIKFIKSIEATNFENISSFIVFLGFAILAAIIFANIFMEASYFYRKKITNSLGNFLIVKIFSITFIRL